MLKTTIRQTNLTDYYVAFMELMEIHNILIVLRASGLLASAL